MSGGKDPEDFELHVPLPKQTTQEVIEAFGEIVSVPDLAIDMPPQEFRRARAKVSKAKKTSKKRGGR